MRLMTVARAQRSYIDFRVIAIQALIVNALNDSSVYIHDMTNKSYNVLLACMSTLYMHAHNNYQMVPLDRGMVHIILRDLLSPLDCGMVDTIVALCLSRLRMMIYHVLSDAHHAFTRVASHHHHLLSYINASNNAYRLHEYVTRYVVICRNVNLSYILFDHIRMIMMNIVIYVIRLIRRFTLVCTICILALRVCATTHVDSANIINHSISTDRIIGTSYVDTIPSVTCNMDITISPCVASINTTIKADEASYTACTHGLLICFKHDCLPVEYSTVIATCNFHTMYVYIYEYKLHWLLWSWHVKPKANRATIIDIYMRRAYMLRHDFRLLLLRYQFTLKSYVPLRYTAYALHHISTYVRSYPPRTAHPLSYINLPMDEQLPTCSHVKVSKRRTNRGGAPYKHIFKVPNVDRITKSVLFSLDRIQSYMNDEDKASNDSDSFYYLGAIVDDSVVANTIMLNVPIHILASQLPRHHLVDIAKLHDIRLKENIVVADIRQLLLEHQCNGCLPIRYIFMPYRQNTSTNRMRALRSRMKAAKNDEQDDKQADVENVASVPISPAMDSSLTDTKVENNTMESDATIEHDRLSDTMFPPAPPSAALMEKICNGFIADTDPRILEEEGCAVCASLNPTMSMSPLEDMHDVLHVLNEYIFDDRVTRKERRTDADPIKELTGIPLATGCNKVCNKCVSYLRKEQIPPLSLANGLWIGDVPIELQGLTFAEKLLISRVRHNGCLVRVSSGMHKLRANAILFQTPIPKVYNILPPPSSEIDEVLAIIYTGPNTPTSEDFKKTPFLVRRNKVAEALDWLKLNHVDYADVIISRDNIMSYPEDMPPVAIGYREREPGTNQEPESTGLDSYDDEDGVYSGECPIAVHGLIGGTLNTLDLKSLTAVALNHLKNGGKVLAVGHAEQPESMYDNPRLYPQIFPWLFPYGLGGLGNARGVRKISEKLHKKHLLMYHDKRFQHDEYFPILAINQEQIKSSTTGGFILTNRKTFPSIANRLLSIDPLVLQDLSRRMELGEKITPETEREKDCFRLIHDIDHVAHRVEGSITSRKYMRNEMWSLTAYKGAPSWFITFSPADNKHPICLYYADHRIEFKPSILDVDYRFRLIANNPVAGARFFDMMVRMFIKHVLGVGTNHPGLYGETSAYYGAVEQQGRLTLHLHLMLWLKCSLTPLEVRERILDPSSDFQTRLIQYLEGVHVGGFVDASLKEVQSSIEHDMFDKEYTDPTMTLPTPAPPRCRNTCTKCSSCKSNSSWWVKFWNTFNDILYRSNRHRCGVRCLANKHNSCSARFPRETPDTTSVDPITGTLTMKKTEAFINTVSPCLTYLMRCNTDVTSLLSGTAIKAVIAYATEYVTKPGLKTHAIFDIVRMLLDKKCEMLSSDITQTEKARKLITSIVNSMTSKMEMGGPMASLYLLGLPDHYTSHTFKCFYWSSFVNVVSKYWNSVENTDTVIDEEDADETLVMMKSNEEYVGTSPVMDYIHRPAELCDMNLYDWIRLTDRIKKGRWSKRNDENEEGGEIGDTIDDDAQEDIASADVANESTHNQDVKEKQRKTTKKYKFLSTHPLYKSHGIELFDEAGARVPNFVGTTLPRRDQGDREYYCRTMLTFFKPWRSGEELKLIGSSWSDTFESHSFTNRQQDIMKNFNIRYECLDARDDYSKRKKGKGDPSYGFGISEDDMDDIDQSAHNEYIVRGLNGCDDVDIDDEGLSYMGSLGLRFLNAGVQITSILKGAGWMDSIIGTIKRDKFTYALDTAMHTATEWNNILKTAKKAILKNRENTYRSYQNKHNEKLSNTTYINQVAIVDNTYLSKSYKCDDAAMQLLIDNTVKSFTLNKEQERAFRIIANHTVHNGGEQLKMYLGGMAGTGKSQVIKALTNLFRSRGEQHRFITLAPTGSAAALIDGSTYHAALGVDTNTEKTDSLISLAEVKTRLQGVDYIFIDEVSMISCRDLYNISKQLAKATNETAKPFGGKNIIFAGDFAQLKPVSQSSLYSHSVGTFTKSGMTEGGQEAAIGKSLWHQITTVVILRENMRQKTQSARDAQFRTALENMRYKMCTPEDLQFLRTLIAGRGKNQPKLAHKRFRYISVITAQNKHKDHINELGLARFAEEHGEILTTFHSVDQWSEVDKVIKKGKTRRDMTSGVLANPMKCTTIIKGKTREALCNLPPSQSDHVAGKLMLCKGLPILIKRNEATECCVTNGAEATVYDWMSHRDTEGLEVLDILFVKLHNPPRTIQLEDLPVNVVPIPRRSKAVKCELHNDQLAFVERSQVMVLPNFAMTDYASQGRTRPDNVVDLNNCRDHQSYYTCLSRSSSADGTVIIQGFDAKKLIGGASGELKKEFRELELLDDITTLRFEGMLDKDIEGHRRHDLIRIFQSKMEPGYAPAYTHKYIKWTADDPFLVDEDTKYEDWRIVPPKGKKNKCDEIAKEKTPDAENVSSANTSSNTEPASEEKKHSMDEDSPSTDHVAIKKAKYTNEQIPNDCEYMYTGIEWDPIDYSCAYDSLFNALYILWTGDTVYWNALFRGMNRLMRTLMKGYHRVKVNDSSLQMTRNVIRESLNSLNCNEFPWGQRGTSVCALIDEIFKNKESIMEYTVYCRTCGQIIRDKRRNSPMIYRRNPDNIYNTTSDQFQAIYTYRTHQHTCTTHDTNIHFTKIPPILLFHTQSIHTKISKHVSIVDDSDTMHTWKLATIIYYGGWHFTSVNIDPQGNMWYSDSKDTPNYAIHINNIQNISEEELRRYENRQAEIAIYTYINNAL